MKVKDTEHPITRGVGEFKVTDELYFTEYAPSVHILLTAQWEEKVYLMAWTKSYGAGRVFYAASGHLLGVFETEGFQKLVIQAVDWASGECH